jgi:TPR repeat protein
MSELGEILAGEGDIAEGERWWLRAAATGDGGALVDLAMLSRFRGDHPAAEAYYRRAADAGHAAAIADLGAYLLEQSRLGEAVGWLTRAADGGSAAGAYHLVLLHHARSETEAALRRLQQVPTTGPSRR